MIKLSEIFKGEDQLVDEVKTRVESGRSLPLASRNGVSNEMIKAVIKDVNAAPSHPHVEAVIVPFMRPVLFVQNGNIELPESNELKERLIKYKPIIEKPLNSVGRIELINHMMRYVGTGWMIDENHIITNRHVAEEFSYKKNNELFFRKSPLGSTVNAKIDFKEEYQVNPDTNNQFEVEIKSITYLPEDDPKNPDMAVLCVKPGNNLPEPVVFIENKLKRDQLIGIIGYPGRDPNGVTDIDMERRIFGEIFGVKRYSPGQIIDVPDSGWIFGHDCSSLGGCSGSLVQDMETGCAVGLHFGGILLESNYAVKGKAILDILGKIERLTPIHFSDNQTKELFEEPELVLEKAFTAESYDDRDGYDEHFLNTEDNVTAIPLPQIKESHDTLVFGSKKETVLKYTHFSLEIKKSRRLCYYSAVNINGQNYVRLKRSGWRLDSRIPEEQQIMKECYGNAPKFSRGHMTRREDPNWGDMAIQANDDTMHVTNVVPQMQSFNAGTWLTLENYALENAKKDHQKISVFTGPFFSENDPVRYGVQIPLEFWKIISFIHDETGKLCATGYTISQEQYVRNEEFVYGGFETYQVPIKVIEKKAKMSFGNLSTIDPLNKDIYESLPIPIRSVRQIKFY